MFFEIALIAPTASGKTSLANALALEFDAVILSLDSLCVYKEINIASAKPELDTLKKLKHFGVNLLSIREHFSVGLFFKEYERAKKYAISHDLPLIIVGGTSFYLKAMLDGLSVDFKESKTELSNTEIYELLRRFDPEFKVERNDTYRLKKWLSIYEMGQIPSEALRKSRAEPLIKELEIYELVINRELLRERIAKRTKQMFENGLLEEARWLFANFDNALKPLNSIGLKECGEFLRGEISLNECENLINIHTAQLAKRQRTFNKKFTSTKLELDTSLEFLRKRFSNQA